MPSCPRDAVVAAVLRPLPANRDAAWSGLRPADLLEARTSGGLRPPDGKMPRAGRCGRSVSHPRLGPRPLPCLDRRVGETGDPASPAPRRPLDPRDGRDRRGGRTRRRRSENCSASGRSPARARARTRRPPPRRRRRMNTASKAPNEYGEGGAGEAGRVFHFEIRRSSIVDVFDFGGDAQCIPRKLTGDHKARSVISLLNER